MTVRELLRALETDPDALLVVVNGCEEGYDDMRVACIRIAKIRLNRKGARAWQGRHPEHFGIEGKEGEGVNASAILRGSH